MPYSVIQKLLVRELNDHQDSVLIESPFRETTRSGTYLRSVLLGVTRKKMVIATKTADFRNRISADDIESTDSDKLFEVRSVYPMEIVKFSVFKRTLRQSLKAVFQNGNSRYYELGNFDKRVIFWKLWCNHARESSSEEKIWPFVPGKSLSIGCSQEVFAGCDVDCIEIQNINSRNQENNRQKWTDKYLYLGSTREVEDKERPRPLPGLGPSEDIKLTYLKPRYFGCWEQSDHWVQCESLQETKCDYNAYTYTGEPTSNVTYTSLMTTWK